MIDEAHSLGTLGKTGRGIAEHFGVDPRDVDLLMGTLSKAMGSCGGYIAGSNAVVEYLKYTSPAFVFAPACTVHGCRGAGRRCGSCCRSRSALTDSARTRRCFCSWLGAAGLNTGMSNNTPVVPVILATRCTP